ncbi:MAG: hypothetical protein LWW87_09465 [Geobacteraceae bacterium]|nr:hypothetical protein [Geobacteraceae bacterium]
MAYDLVPIPWGSAAIKVADSFVKCGYKHSYQHLLITIKAIKSDIYVDLCPALSNFELETLTELPLFFNVKSGFPKNKKS